jgi:hypothetical protein
VCLALVLGFGAATLLERDEGEKVSAAPADGPKADDGSASDTPPEGALPGAVPDVQAVMTFTPDVTRRRIDRVEREWRANRHLLGVVVMSAEEVEAEIGLSTAAIAAWGDEEDRDAIERFVCGYQGEPGIALAGLDDPCEPSSTSHPAQLQLQFGDQVTAAHRETIRRDFTDATNAIEADVDSIASGEGWDLLTVTADAADGPILCNIARRYLDEPGVTLLSTSGTGPCP